MSKEENKEGLIEAGKWLSTTDSRVDELREIIKETKND